MERRDLSAANWVTTRLVTAGIVGLGVLFVLQPQSVVDWCGGPNRFFGWGLFIAFAFIASLSWEKNQLRVRCAELMEGMNQLLYGKDFRTQREAIDILLNALESKDPVAHRTAHEHLVRLTGQNFADDVQVWRAWWSAHQSTWAPRK